MRHQCAAVLVLSVFATALSAQHRVDPRWSYHRAIAVVPLQGAGPPSRAGIIAFTFEPSDNGKFAIAEFVAVDRTGLAEVFADQSAGVLVFEKGVTPAATIEAVIRPFRKDFSLQNFGVPVQ
jgi:hypothetical protein